MRDVGELKKVTVLCTHWGLDENERLQQAEALAGIIARAPRPLVLCGDLNEQPNCSAVKLLISRTGLIDADAEANRPTFIAGSPTQRIDYCLYSSDLRTEQVEVGSSLASDHLPLCVDLSTCPT